MNGSTSAESAASTGAPAPSTATPPGLPPGPGAAFLRHVGSGRALLAITLVNLLLKVVTLGMYHFWAKTRVRRYVWSHTLFQGEAFEYTGRPQELLKGYLLAMLVVLPVLGFFQALPYLAETYPVVSIAGSAVAYPVLIFLGGFAGFSSRRYLLSRTRWRSVRFGLTGRARDHGLKTVAYMLLTSITMGLFTPLMRNRLTAHLVDNAWFGSQRFSYDGRDNALLLRFIAALGLFLAMYVLLFAAVFAGVFLLGDLLTNLDLGNLAPLIPVLIGLAAVVVVLPTMALIWAWYAAGEWRYQVAHTTLADARFTLELPTRRYLWLVASNLFALAFTLGLAYPWAVVRTARTLADALRLHGTLDLESIAQHAGRPPGMGEGLADALDLGAI